MSVLSPLHPSASQDSEFYGRVRQVQPLGPRSLCSNLSSISLRLVLMMEICLYRGQKCAFSTGFKSCPRIWFQIPCRPGTETGSCWVYLENGLHLLRILAWEASVTPLLTPRKFLGLGPDRGPLWLPFAVLHSCHVSGVLTAVH